MKIMIKRNSGVGLEFLRLEYFSFSTIFLLLLQMGSRQSGTSFSA